MTERVESPGSKSRVRLGIVGCGYVTAESHLPASVLVPEVEVVALVDTQLARARKLAETFNVPLAVDDYRALFERVDAVIIALPHQMHAPVALEFLGRGIHVLCEKPMAVSVDECRKMIAVARNTSVKLAVGHVRRFYDNMRLAKQLIATEFLGKVERFEAKESVAFASFPASAFTVQPPFGGILWDTGPHTLDLLLWWFGDAERLCYRDDALGGVEANCELELTTTAGVSGTVELSRIRSLGNLIRVYCHQGILEVPLSKPDSLTIHSAAFSTPIQLSRAVGDGTASTLVPFFARQLSEFAGAVAGARELTVPGSEGLRSVAAIEGCRQVREQIRVPVWRQLREHVMARVQG